MTWFVKIYYVELDLGERLVLGRKNWNTAHGEGGERIVSLASSRRHIRERCVPTLGGVLERDIFFADACGGILRYCLQKVIIYHC